MVIPFDKKAENRASIFVEIVIESKSGSYPPVLWRTAISFAETWDKWEDKGIYEKDDFHFVAYGYHLLSFDSGFGWRHCASSERTAKLGRSGAGQGVRP